MNSGDQASSVFHGRHATDDGASRSYWILPVLAFSWSMSWDMARLDLTLSIYGIGEMYNMMGNTQRIYPTLYNIIP